MVYNLTGWQNSIWRVRKRSDDSTVEIIELEETNGEGMIVEYEDFYGDEEEILDYSAGEDNVDIIVDPDYLGTRYRWTFNWTDLITTANGLKIKKLLDYRIGNANYFEVKPRKDTTKYYRVHKVKGTEQLRVGKGGADSTGDYGYSFIWETVGLVKELDWRDPNTGQYSGENQPVQAGQKQ